MELGFNIWPSVKLTIYMDRWPILIKNWLLKWHLYQDAVQTAKECLEISDPVPKTVTRKVLQLDRIAGGLITFPTSVKFMDAFNPFIFQIPKRLGIDMILTMGYPSAIVRGKVRRHNKLFYVSEDWNLIDVDEVGDIRNLEPYESESEAQMKKVTEAFDEDPIDEKAGYIGKMVKSVQGKLALVPQFNGIMESWHIIWGMGNMHQFFRHLIREFRMGPPYGEYKKFLRKKADFIGEYVKRLAEEGVKFVGLVEDVAHDHGPFIKTEVYKKFFVPEIKRVVDTAHKADMKVFFHTDGRFKVLNSDQPWSFLDAILSTGIDMLHGCQQDCNNLKELKEYVGSKVTLVGGVSCVYALQRAKTAKEVYKIAGSAIETLKQGGHYIIAADNGWHVGVKMENIRWYLNAVKHYGKY